MAELETVTTLNSEMIIFSRIYFWNVHELNADEESERVHPVIIPFAYLTWICS